MYPVSIFCAFLNYNRICIYFIAVCVIIGNGGSPIKFREEYLQPYMFIILNAIKKKRQQSIS